MNALTDFEILEDGFQSEYDKIEVYDFFLLLINLWERKWVLYASLSLLDLHVKHRFSSGWVFLLSESSVYILKDKQK